MNAGLNKMLAKVFAEATELYQQRGFQRRVGFGKKPALVNVDLANAWTRPGNPFTCEHIDDQIIPGVQRLLAACRENGHPVIHVTTCYQVTDRNNPHTQELMGQLGHGHRHFDRDGAVSDEDSQRRRIGFDAIGSNGRRIAQHRTKIEVRVQGRKRGVP
ncbi:N-carbamoylsarcosine amidase [Candidatus Burkholderia humilis]|nr:N-carbamoylsarcosine amidase [Candidatus Burkholderia humilis]